MDDESSQPVATEHETRLAAVLGEMMDAAQRGESVALETVCAAHPDLKDELRELWGAVQFAEAAGQSERDENSRGESPDDESRVIGATQIGGPLAAGNRGASATFEPPYDFGQYRLNQELGRGGMGVVYLAEQATPRRDVALKMLLRGQLASEHDQDRFRAEAEAAAALDHPHIVPVYEVGEISGRLYFSMKHIQGETLAERILKRGPLRAADAAELLAKVARAIDFAHRRGVLHRDLKPSNILIDAEGEPHVSDFGLAKRESDPTSLTRTGAVLGTPAYMSPEQAGGSRDVGPASDVYSLGAILYFMLTGEPPFQGESPVEAVLKVLEQEPRSPRSVNPRADRDLELIALRCLQKPPDLRYGSAAALADDLEAFLNDEPLAARSGRFSQVVAQMFRETHHATVLENWGVLWMWHSIVLLMVCLVTNLLHALGDTNRLHYAGLWVLALGAWAAVFWTLRRRIGPVTFVERQIAHVWAGSMVCIAMVFPLEWWLELPPLTLSPVLGLVSMMVFIVKGGILSGQFYLQAAALFCVSIAMAIWPAVGHVIFGVVSAACFFLPGLKYYLQRKNAAMRAG